MRVLPWLAACLILPSFALADVEWPTSPGLHKVKLELTGLLGQRRKVHYYVPKGLQKSEPVPLVVALHGGISSPKNIRRRSMLDQLAEREKLVAVFPQGNGLLGHLLHWNAGTCCGKATEKGVDDVGFVLHTIDRLAELLPVDLSRVYVFGFSNGAMLTYSLAAQHPDRVAAIAAISGTFGRVAANGEYDWQLQPPAGGMPTLIIHGSADPRLPYAGIANAEDGRGGNGMIPVLESARFWARANGCSNERETDSGFANVVQYAWSDCSTGHPVSLYRLENWGHRWAGSSRHTKADYTTVGEFESVEVIWDFFRGWRTRD